jgi:CopG-like RHH_1 or ribbon-helix-helix domain, RHH_5
MAEVRKSRTDEEEPPVTPSGTEITEEYAERLADHFESEDFDPTNWQRRYVGRPSLSEAGSSPRVSFRVPTDIYKAAWKRADKEGRSLSSLAREALERYLDS